MRASDTARLSEPYPENDSPRGRSAMSALGIDIASWRQLESTILDDLAEAFPYGIRWWAPHPGTKRRILISDQLYACATSVADNMIEAGLHWLEFLDRADQESDRLADSVAFQNGQPTIVATSPRTPLEELGTPFVRMHVIDTVRALAGALDCLAGTIIGVLALPAKILTADFNRVRTQLGAITAPPTEGCFIQAQFGAKLENAIKTVGPQGWLEWALAFRNMTVHRGRRLELGQFVPRGPTLYGANGEPILRARRMTHLPRDPWLSDVEVFLNSPQELVLSEDASVTLAGILRSTRDLINFAAVELSDAWNWRRANPQSLLQPAEQWPELRSAAPIRFLGYAPGSLEFPSHGTVGMVHPDVAHRFGAAALYDESRGQWDAFD